MLVAVVLLVVMMMCLLLPLFAVNRHHHRLRKASFAFVIQGIVKVALILLRTLLLHQLWMLDLPKQNLAKIIIIYGFALLYRIKTFNVEDIKIYIMKIFKIFERRI